MLRRGRFRVQLAIAGGRRSSDKPRAAVDGGCVLDGFINNLKGKVAIVTGAASGIRSPFIFELPAGQPKAHGNRQRHRENIQW